MRRSSIGKGNVTMGAVKPIELIAGAREVEAVEEILEKIRNPRLCNPPRHRRQGQSLGCIAECAYGPASPTLAGWACSWHGCPGTVLWRAAPVRLHERPEHETAHRRRRGGLSFGGSPGSPLVRGRPHRDVRSAAAMCRSPTAACPITSHPPKIQSTWPGWWLVVCYGKITPRSMSKPS